MTLLLEDRELAPGKQIPLEARTANLEPTDRFGVNWAGRTVLVVGLGKSGLAACRLLERLGCRVRVSELRQRPEMQEIASQLRASGVEQVDLGHQDPQIIDGCDVAIVSPGVPESAPPLQWATARGLPVLSEVELAFRFCRAPVVAVTGTNGKSTTVTLIHRVLQAARRKAVACGNLGTPCCDVLPGLSPASIAVIEVSSFQLLACDQFRPHVAVLLNLGANHLDRHSSREMYIAAKARLFQRQGQEDHAVLNGRDPEVEKLAWRINAQRVWFGKDHGNPPALRIHEATARALPDSAQAVLQVCRILSIPDPLTYQVIREFRGLEHRMEYVTTVRGVRIINDSKSTTPDSLLYALGQCRAGVVAIIGGRDKGLDFRSLGPALRQERVRGVVLIGEARTQIRGVIEQGPGGEAAQRIREAETLDSALTAAMSLAEPGDTLLFSPACASFDMFKNFEDRGRAFKALVKQLQAQDD